MYVLLNENIILHIMFLNNGIWLKENLPQGVALMIKVYHNTKNVPWKLFYFPFPYTKKFIYISTTTTHQYHMHLWV